MRLAWIVRAAAVAALALAACGEPRQPTSPQPTTADDAAPDMTAEPAPTGGTFAQPPPSTSPPDAAPTAPAPVAGTCAADAQHCCLPDGRIVRPGGCQPVYRDGDHPATRRRADGTCEPIECTVRCLPATARIATPAGEVAVTALSVGDLVWTVDARGARVAAPVLAASSREVVTAHEVVELTLSDGRVVRASPEHPDATGVPLAALAPGAALDGATVTATRRVPYAGDRTWDLLPAGATGAYWADGVLVGSTLRHTTR